MLRITSHAVYRYRERCLPEERLWGSRAIRERILEMASFPDSLKFLSGGRILIHGDWILIQAENRIVTVYKGDERKIVRKKIKKKQPLENFDSDDSEQSRESKPYSRLERVKNILRGW